MSDVEDLSEELIAEMDRNEAAGPVDPRAVPVRFSNLKQIGRSALHYLDAVQSDRPDTLAMRLGRGVHALALGTPVTRYPGRRAGKAWEAFKAAHQGVEILSGSEWQESKNKSAALLMHELAAPILFGDGVIREQLLAWSINGRACTGKPDAVLGTDYIADLKSTKDGDPERFVRGALRDGYAAQLAWYANGVEILTGKRVRDLYVVTVEQKRPYCVTVYKLTDEARTLGDRTWRMWWERLAVCEAANAWPGYSSSVVPFDVAQDEFGITFGGKTIGEMSDDDNADHEEQAA